jgi:VanZ family protein
MVMRNKLIIVTLCFLCIIGTLFWGLRPFNFNSVNGVEWLKEENGIFFYNLGVIYGSAELGLSDRQSPLSKNESVSIEIWLTPGSAGSSRFACIFGIYNENLSEIFSFSQGKSLLNLSKYQSPKNNNSNHDWRWLKDVFLKGQRRFLTITSDKSGTTVYIDGRWARKYQNYSLIPAELFVQTERIVIGNDPTGKRPWTGKVHGLAIYSHSLSSKKVFEHFEKWRNGSALSLLNEQEVIALYPMDEQKGNLIHNTSNNRYKLSIPDRFKILKKNFLEFSGSAFERNDTSRWDMLINIIGFIPLGYLLFLVFNSYSQPLKMSAWRLIILPAVGGMVISLIIEINQAYLPTRNSSLSDLIFNALGANLGIIIALIIKLKRNKSTADCPY